MIARRERESAVGASRACIACCSESCRVGDSIGHLANIGQQWSRSKVNAALEDISVALMVHVNSIKDLDSIVCEPSQSARQSDVFLNRVFLAARRFSPWQQWPVIGLAFRVLENLLLGEYIENRASFYLKSCSFVWAHLSREDHPFPQRLRSRWW
jgi:hypothetical protein